MEFKEGDTECLGKWQLREKVNSHRKFEGKLKMVLKTALTVQNTFFATEVSRQEVANITRQNTSIQKFWKIC